MANSYGNINMIIGWGYMFTNIDGSFNTIINTKPSAINQQSYDVLIIISIRLINDDIEIFDKQ